MATESRDLLRELERSVGELQAFNEIGRTLASTLDLHEVLSLIMEKVSTVLRPGHWSLLLVDEATRELVFEIVVGEGAERLKPLRLPIGEGIAGHVVASGEPVLLEDARVDPRFAGRFDEASGLVTGSVLAAPLVSRGRALGVIELVNPRGGRVFDGSDLRTLQALADFGAIAIDNARAYERIRELTLRDDHTGLFNARHLWSQLRLEVARSRRTGRPFSLVFLDLDRFKAVNDTHGHQAGSAVLREVGELVHRQMRSIDVPVRYGGDEFVVLLPETTAPAARQAAERLRAAVNGAAFLASRGLEIRVTASFGIASFPEDGKTAEELLQLADAAMYRVKETTRDGIAAAGDLPGRRA
ncbi:MAG TPA: sensor domain-containing diguanylate cyclase [Anaeromyxobacteraceae bacterium]|nr:sensor domain-containing diguanylate cyclase [Anaeromyxobacteraceae bacterium]